MSKGFYKWCVFLLIWTLIDIPINLWQWIDGHQGLLLHPQTELMLNIIQVPILLHMIRKYKQTKDLTNA